MRALCHQGLVMPSKIHFKTGDRLTIKYADDAVSGVVDLASTNGRSLFLTFEGFVAGHHGAMPVMWVEEDDAFKSIVTDTVVELGLIN
jgi:hypothetical protein